MSHEKGKNLVSPSTRNQAGDRTGGHVGWIKGHEKSSWRGNAGSSCRSEAGLSFAECLVSNQQKLLAPQGGLWEPPVLQNNYLVKAIQSLGYTRGIVGVASSGLVVTTGNAAESLSLSSLPLKNL